MWVKLLIGRLADSVVDVPFTAGQISIDNGTAVLATDEEIIAAGFDPRPTAALVDVNTLPAGYRAEPTEAGGFDLLDAAGLRLNDHPIHNIAAVLSFAHDHHVATLPPQAEQPPVPIYDAITLRLKYDLYRVEEMAGDFLVFDAAGVAIPGGPFETLGKAELARHQHVAAAHGLPLEEYEAITGKDIGSFGEDDEGAGDGAATPAAVPENWRDLQAKDRKTLAAKLAGRRIATVAEADGVLEALSAPAENA